MTSCLIYTALYTLYFSALHQLYAGPVPFADCVITCNLRKPGANYRETLDATDGNAFQVRTAWLRLTLSCCSIRMSESTMMNNTGWNINIITKMSWKRTTSQIKINMQDFLLVLIWHNVQDGGASQCWNASPHVEKGEKEGKGDWKINGVCDWQPMILGIRLNWIKVRESAGQNPGTAWNALIVNIQEHFPPSPSPGYKAWSQNTPSSVEAYGLKGFKSKPARAFEGSQPGCANTSKLVFARNKLASCWQDVKRHISVPGLSEGRLIFVNITEVMLKCKQVGQL